MKKRQCFWSIVLSTMLFLVLLPLLFKPNSTEHNQNSPQSVTVEASSKPALQTQNNANQQANHPQDHAVNQGNQPEDKPIPEEKPAIVWGIDTASKVDQAFLQCVKDNYGGPAVVGRYLETKEDISIGLTGDEVNFLHQQGVKILPIFNHFTDATRYENGAAEAKEAISYAQKLGIPNGVAIFADIEPTYPVDAAFIQGWVDAFGESSYRPGIYGVLTLDGELTAAYQTALSENKNVQTKTILWGSNPDPGVTTKAEAPAYQPGAPEAVNVSIWQYGIDGETCNIDTNLIQSTVLESLW